MFLLSNKKWEYSYEIHRLRHYFFSTINQSIAGTWQCPEKTSNRDVEYTVLFESPRSDTNVITMGHINTKTKRDAFGALNLKVLRGDDNSKIAVLVTPHTIRLYYFDLERVLVTRSKTGGSIAPDNLIKTTYKCKN